MFDGLFLARKVDSYTAGPEGTRYRWWCSCGAGKSSYYMFSDARAGLRQHMAQRHS